MLSVCLVAAIFGGTADPYIVAGLAAVFCGLRHRGSKSRRAGADREPQQLPALGPEALRRATEARRPQPEAERTPRGSRQRRRALPTTPVASRLQATGNGRPEGHPRTLAWMGAPAARRRTHGFEVYTRWPFDATEAKRRQSETANALGRGVEEKIELGAGLLLTMVLVPAGQFLMGSPEKEKGRADREALRPVTVERPLWIGKYHVTQEQWEAVMGSNPSLFRGPKNPVESVSWSDVQEFLKKLNVRFSGSGLALPAEEQWEYACRAGTASAFHFGETVTADQAHSVWTCPDGPGQSGRSGPRTRPVGKFPPNAWGLHDMHGNVWEWCASPYAKKYDGSESKGAEAPGRLRVVRGGSWYGQAVECRSACRVPSTPGFRSICSYGVRLARPLP